MKGGSTNKLPVTTTKAEDFQKEWKLNYLSGHSRLNNKIFVVPANTYLFFVASGGIGAAKEELADIDALIYLYKKGALKEPTKEDWYSNIFKLFKKENNQGKNVQTLFQDLVYDPAKERNQETASKRAFYEPNDIVQDLRCSFENDYKPIFPMGVFDLPLPYSMKDNIAEFNENEEEELVEEETDKRFFNVASNFYKKEMFETKPRKTFFTLFDILNDLNKKQPLAKGSKRLLILDTCRVPKEAVHKEKGNTEEITTRKKALEVEEIKLSRTLSEVGRSCPAIQTQSVINLTTLRNMIKRLPRPDIGSNEEKLKKSIEKLLTALYNDEEDERKQADRSLLIDVIQKAEAAGKVVRGGTRRRSKKSKKLTRRRK